jgi:F5/8 type C domain-containing protein/amylo-alpha-1,6-glucosidase
MSKPEDVSIDPAAWLAVASGQADLKLSAARLRSGSALRMDFDFKGGGGFVVARHAVERTMPEDYVLHLRLRGRGAANNIEFKLVDATGQNVWRHVKKSLAFPARWTRTKVESREMEFAWGPAGGGVMRALGAIEIAIVAGTGGAGTVWIADLSIEGCNPTAAPQVNASSALPGFAAAQGLTDRGWKPRADDPRPWIVVDSIEPRRLGGLIIEWLHNAPAGGFRVSGSLSGRRWKTLHVARHAGGSRSYVYLPNTRVRFLRLEISEPSGGAALRPQSFEFSRSIEAFWHNIAKCEPRGWHPRWLHREQSFWTPSGISNGTQCALLNEEGMVEAGAGTYSIEPMLWVQKRLFTWADISIRQALAQGYLPVPGATWEAQNWHLRIRAETTELGSLRLRYAFENLTHEPLSARLFVLMRPFQVTPPWQSFGKLGGVSRIHELTWSDGAVHVNNTTLLAPGDAPAAFAATTFDEGSIVGHLARGTLPVTTAAHDAFGFAQGVLSFELSLQACESREIVVICMPVGAAAGVTDEPAFAWDARLPVTQWAASDWAADVIRAALTATAHVLVTRSGPALQPGPRRYTRSWIRDGTIMSAALLRMGRANEVREFIRWYAPYQRPDGFVPCCVDASGPDWLVEHDSHGQLIALIADYYRFTADEELVKEFWTCVDRAVGCIAGLLEEDGLLPISVSHEGYLAQPVHSYWDDFWALRGLRDAVELARMLGKVEVAARWQELGNRFATALFSSIERTRKERSLSYIPGSIEWADFDPTSTANAIAHLDMLDGLDRDAVQHTFDRYLYDWRRKRSGALEWQNYTPYEIRIVGAFVHLGRRDAALELLRFFLADRRPPAWNQWPEIAWRDPRAPAHLGDLPHTWIAAEYVLAVRSLFAYERAADNALVIAAGLAPEWLANSGVHVIRMPTPYGPLSFSLRRLDAHTLRFEMTSALTAKLVLRPPLPAELSSVTINGEPCTSFDRESVTLVNAPAALICIMSAEAAGAA